MKQNHSHSECACGCNSSSRREFLGSVAAGAVALGAGIVLNYSTQPVFGNLPDGKKLRIRVFFVLYDTKNLIQSVVAWPIAGYNHKPDIDAYKDALQKTMPDVDFVFSLTSGPKMTDEILAEDGDSVHGYLVVQDNNWVDTVQTVAATGKPTLHSDILCSGSGGFLTKGSAALRKNPGNYAWVASSNLNDVLEAVKCFNVIVEGKTAKDFVDAVTKVRKERTKPFDAKITDDPVDCISTEELLNELKNVKILMVEKGGFPKEAALGVEYIPVTFEEFGEVLHDVTGNRKEDIENIVATWRQNARLILEGVGNDDSLFHSAAIYLAQKALLEQYGALAISMNCLGGFQAKVINGYPCLGFHELQNSGFIGGCEADVQSVFTMAVINKLTKGCRPGFISDPILDMSKRQIIYAHCVAPTKWFGPNGDVCNFDILRHCYNREGASVRSFGPSGYVVTTLEMNPNKKQILFHQAVAVDNLIDPRGCRTKLCCEVMGDYEKILNEWDRWGWHRVTFYGDLKKPVFDFAKAVGWEVIEDA